MRRWIALAMFAMLGATASTLITASRSSSAEEKTPLAARVFEMRTYYTNPGLLPQLHERFREHTNYLFVKHGMQLIGYWTPQGEADALVYILAYDSLEAREKSWNGFRDDEEWKRVYKASHDAAGGPIVKKVESKYLDPTNYSPIR